MTQKTGVKTKKEVSQKPVVKKINLKRIEVQVGNVLGVAVQDLNEQPKDHSVYKLALYRNGQKFHQEDMKVFGAGFFVINEKEVRDGVNFVMRAGGKVPALV